MSKSEPLESSKKKTEQICDGKVNVHTDTQFPNIHGKELIIPLVHFMNK